MQIIWESNLTMHCWVMHDPRFSPCCGLLWTISFFGYRWASWMHSDCWGGPLTCWQSLPSFGLSCGWCCIVGRTIGGNIGSHSSCRVPLRLPWAVGL